LLGLLGVLIAAVLAGLNSQVTALALTDVRGGLGISSDPGTWLESLYISSEAVGMVLSAWLLVTFSLRRFTLFVIAFNCLATVLIPLAADIDLLYTLRSAQGLAGGLTIPLLMTAALRITSPSIRLYGLAVYALTATVTPGVAATLAALWTEIVGWRFVFFEAVPFCALAGVLAWYGLPQDPPRYERFRMFDWRGALLAVVGFASLTTMLQQGDRLDWFNSRPICVLALLSAVSISLLLVNEWFHPLPLLKLQMLSRRNFLYGVVALFLLLVIGLSAGKIPLSYLREIQGYRQIQSYPVILEIALLQLVMLPLVAFVLDFAWVDARVVSAAGLGCILIACLGCSTITPTWNRGQFYLWQFLQGIGQPLLIVPLLMIATNSVTPQEGPFASALVNTPRALAEATSVWLFQLIMRWRGGLHTDRLLDAVGQSRFRVIQAKALLPNHLPPLLPSGRPRAPGSLDHFAGEIARQASVLSFGDAFLIIAALTIGLMIVLLVLPVRTRPPRIQLARK